MSTTGARLRALRTTANLSQSQMATATGLSNGFISLLESGRRAPSDATLQILADTLGTTAAYLRDGAPTDAERAAQGLVLAAEQSVAAGDPAAAMTALARVRLADVTHLYRARLLRVLGVAHDALGETEEAISAFEVALALARAEKRATDIAEIGMWLVGSYLEVGSLGHAVALGESLVREVEDLGLTGTDEHLRLGSTLVWAVFERGDHTYASVRARQLIAVAEQGGSPRARGSVYWNAALIAQARGNDERGLDLARTALDLMLEAGAGRDVPRLRYDLAYMFLRAHPSQPHAAMEQLTLAEADLRLVGSVIEVARWTIEAGRAHLQLGDLDAAEDMATKGLAGLGGTVNLETCEGHILLGEIAARRGDLTLAERRFRWAADRLSMMEASRRAAVVWATLGARLADIGDVAGAARAKGRALTEAGIRGLAPRPKVVASAERTSDRDEDVEVREPLVQSA